MDNELEKIKKIFDSRLKSNLEILKYLEELTNKMPHMRFGQLITNFCVHPDKDFFNEESVDILNRVKQRLNNTK